MVPVRSKVTYAGSVKAGDIVELNSQRLVIERVIRARGRKPAEGANLHLVVAGGDVMKVNSTHPVRVVRGS